ncbi:transposase [Tissierella sp. MSJ-40]|uniref:Transposase n=1 Tax=Tissierella simiarum TaxID=2841534 RepID=A0ABS6E759_9FIRM|nr:transposase [Tissierella simiarum]MBU5438755.1 transposase [Tissierella simiarum]
MPKGNKRYTEEFKNTIVELHNAGKTLGELSSEYGLSKSTIAGWIKKSQPITIEKDKIVTQADYQAMLKRMAKLEEENEILKKAMAIFAKK